jgi:arylsulfatase A-like enzyme
MMSRDSRDPGTHSLIGLVLAVLILALATSPRAGQSAEPEPSRSGPRPNIVFLYTDDQARWAMGAYGNPDIRTPHLDRLARRGAIFRNAFTVTPVCSPSRAALMTSRYPSELGIADWIRPQNEPDLGLAPSAITWPELLKGFGYRTMLAGKWHLGTRDEPGVRRLLWLSRWRQPADRPDPGGRWAGPPA